MKHIHFIVYTIFIFISLVDSSLKAQEYRSPLDLPMLLSANFGELRPNHFHGGLDMKTQGVEGKAVHAVQDGYVSRISVSPWGYGNALYLTHPNGTTTLYGHLKRFSTKIARFVISEQYKKESFQIDIHFKADQIPVRKGEVVAYSGNTGSSGGPHLHFEIRDTKSEKLTDPILFFKNKIVDTRPPQIHGIMVCPFDGKGVINNQRKKLKFRPVRTKTGKQIINGKIEAWGKIGLALSANDYMNNTTNIYGVKDVTLTVDGQNLFHYHMNGFGFEENRYINSLIDYEEYKKNGKLYMRNYLEPGNKLVCVQTYHRGILYINEEKIYHLLYCLTDAFGNQTRLSVDIEGKKQIIPQPQIQHTDSFSWNSENKFGAKGIRFTIPKGCLYNNLNFNYSVKSDQSFMSDVHVLHDVPIPFHKGAQLSVRLLQDSLQSRNQYGIVRIDKNRCYWIGGTYRKGWIDGNIMEMGTYAISKDTKAPVITPLQSSTWSKSKTFRFKLADNLSGVKTYRAEIDGKFVLFEMNRYSIISYHLDSQSFPKGIRHLLKIIVDDAVGNQTEYKYSFLW